MRVSVPRLEIVLHTGIHIANWPRIRRYHPAIANQVRADTILPNPEYLEALRQGRKGYTIPRHIVMGRYDERTHVLTLPMGYLVKFSQYARYLIDSIKDDRVSVPATPPQNVIQLRDYQAPAVAAMLGALHERGFALLEAPPGAGKTEMGLEICARLGQRTLWVTHTLELANQVRQRAVARLGIPESEIGMIGDGKRTIGPFLTIGLIPTLAKLDISVALLDLQFGTIVLDECHHSPAETWSKVIGSFPARYRFGVTGSLERRDGLQTITHLIFGPTTYGIPRETVQLAAVNGQGGGVLPATLRTVRLKGEEYVPKAWTEYKDKEADYKRRLELFQAGKLSRQPRKPQFPYNAIITELLNNEHRNRRIVELLARIAPGRHTLVLSARVDHCQLLEERLRQLRPGLRVATIHGQQPAAVRGRILQLAREGEIDVLFSVNVAKEGLDLPILDQLVLVAGGRDPIYIKQAIGRIQRTYVGKRDCIVWDIIDEDVDVLRAQWWARRRVYIELGMLQPKQRQAALVTA
ncbi:MAG: hypothetical protein BAA04_07055 [Firmicutes bacterium ZCTH02-B6]|nr:MAG: hypothetical protein BAA04_07055 [Firmicutes bacterium ZCTH02-B6]